MCLAQARPWRNGDALSYQLYIVTHVLERRSLEKGPKLLLMHNNLMIYSANLLVTRNRNNYY